MTLRRSDLQSDSNLDSIRNSCDVSKPPNSLLILAQSCRRSSLHLNVFPLNFSLTLSHDNSSTDSTHYIWNEVINCWRPLPDWSEGRIENYPFYRPGQYETTKEESKLHRCPRIHSRQMSCLPVKMVIFAAHQEFDRKVWRHFKVGVFCGGAQGSSWADHE